MTTPHSFSPIISTSIPTPLFNIPEISLCFGGKEGNQLLLDEQGLMRAVETILFPGSKIQLLKKMSETHVWQVWAENYISKTDLFLDERFLHSTEVCRNFPNPLPSAAKILAIMEKLEHTRYIWGGNWPQGIEFLSKLYPSTTSLDQLDPLIRDTWHLKGVDCSGLLYFASQAATPRNTSSLVNFGNPVPIEGQTLQEILNQLKPLDLIVWKGHVICVFDRCTVIESKMPEGVIKTSSQKRLSQILKERKPTNQWDDTHPETFVIRRWHPLK